MLLRKEGEQIQSLLDKLMERKKASQKMMELKRESSKFVLL
jgi:hypothetical protein